MNNLLNFSSISPAVIVLLLLWTLPWKGAALWQAARRRDSVWFIVFMVVNTLAILEILYIFIWAKRKPER